jgi:phosphoglycerate dehydrogenase-like enzyme
MRPFKILLTGDYLSESGRVEPSDIGLDVLDDAPNVQAGFLLDQKPDSSDPTYWDRLYSLEIKPHHIAEANGLVVCRPWVKASAFSSGAENLLVIGRAGAGYDKIDLEACTANDVAVFYSPDTLTHSTATAALLFMLALAMQLPQQERLARTGRWDRQATVKGKDLTGQTLGIVGMGNTGQELARLVSPFKVRVLAYSPHADAARARALGVTMVPTIDELLREADFVSLHRRLLESTRGMMGEREFRLMKPTAYFINVARGELVQQDVLVRCLRDRWIAGAGLDVFEEEPLPAGNPLIGLDNVILTPHYLPATQQASRATVGSILRGMLRIADGALPNNILNTEVLDRPGFRAKLANFGKGAPDQS